MCKKLAEDGWFKGHVALKADVEAKTPALIWPTTHKHPMVQHGAHRRAPYGATKGQTVRLTFDQHGSCNWVDAMRALDPCGRTPICLDISVNQIWWIDGSRRTHRSGWVKPLKRCNRTHV
jgi:hypothetical protein